MFDSVLMCEFLSQFKLLNNFSVVTRDLKNIEILQQAILLDLVKDWIPKNGRASCTYYKSTICTLKGRLFFKKNKGV